jgi:hypothetical protein
MLFENAETFAPNLYLAVGGDDFMVVIYELLKNTTCIRKYQYIIMGELEREDRVYALQYSRHHTVRYLVIGDFNGVFTIVRNNLV